MYNSILDQNKAITKKEGEEIKQFGGLHVIGTERHESRRIDNQLRGRAGRQGDPGSSRFFLCLEDRLLRIFGGDQILNVMQNIGFEDSTPIQSPILNKSLESAQKKSKLFITIQENSFLNMIKRLICNVSVFMTNGRVCLNKKT